MSADNWSECPKCIVEICATYEKKVAESAARLQAAYGKVDAEEYLRMSATHEELVDGQELAEETLREDYEQGIHEGKYFCDYSAVCQQCGWSFTFNHEEKLKIKK